MEPSARNPNSHAAWRFFLVAFGITWTVQLPPLLAKLGVIAGPLERYLPLAGLGAFGPLLGAVVVARFDPEGGGVRALFRPMRAWRVSPVWYLVALGLPAASYVAGRAVYGLCGGTDAAWFYAPMAPERLVAAIVFPLGEEVGWRGFALPQLQRRYSRLASALVVGVGWALWHIPMFLIASTPAAMFPVLFVFMIAGSVTFSWIYNHTGGSLLLAVLAHVGAHLCNPTQVIDRTSTPIVILTAAICAAAVSVVVMDRDAWRAPSVPDARSAVPA